MRPRTLIILAIACVVFILGAVAVNLNNAAFTSSTGGQLLFPGFPVNDAAWIAVTTGDKKLVVTRGDKGWVIASKDDFPARFEMVKQTLVGLAQERAVEAKTAEPSLYPRLEVEDVTARDAKSALLSVEDSKNAVLASLILGKQHGSRTTSGPDQIYVRKPGEARAWLAEGPLARNDNWKLWAQTNILGLDRDRVREVDVTPTGGKSFRVTHDKPGEGELTLQDIPADSKVKDVTNIDALAAALGLLKLDDVMAAKNLKPDAKLLRKLDYHSFDGLLVSLAEYEQDGKDWFKVTAAYEPPPPPTPAAAAPTTGAKPAAPAQPGAAEAPKEAAAPADAGAPKAKSADEVKKEAADIAARTDGWAYQLPPADVATLNKSFSDLVEPKVAPKPKG